MVIGTPRQLNRLEGFLRGTEPDASAGRPGEA